MMALLHITPHLTAASCLPSAQAGKFLLRKNLFYAGSVIEFLLDI